MQIKMLGHACLLLQEKNFTLITDPWFGFPFYFETYHAYPPLEVPKPEELQKVQAIHISHIHQDHFCPRSLAFFDRQVPIYIADYPDKTFLQKIEKLGFQHIHEIPPGPAGVQAGPFRLHSFLSVRGAHDFDSALVVQEKNKNSYIFTNDCFLDSAQCDEIGTLFPDMQGGFLGYCDIHPYPSCYETTTPVETTLAEMHEKNKTSLENLCQKLKLSWAVPYANGLRFLDPEIFLHNRLFTDREIFKNTSSTTRLLWQMNPQDVLNSEGEFISRKEISETPLEKRTTPPGSEPETPWQNYHEKFADLLQDFLKTASAAWTEPMNLQIIVTANEQKKMDFFFSFRNQRLTSVAAAPDLVLSYRFSDIRKLCEGHFGFIQLHYMYRFEAKIHQFMGRQSLVHKWGTL